MARSSLSSEHPKRLDIPGLIVASMVTLCLGLAMPVVQLSSALYEDTRYSVLIGLLKFLQSGDYFLALLIFVFSAVFPVVKLIALVYLWFAPTVRENRRRNLRIIEPLGKWSMLDVLVVILFAGAVKLGFIADARVLYGAYVYGAAILMSMVAAVLMSNVAGPEPALSSMPRARSWLLPLLSLLGLLLLLLGMLMPLMQVEKWLFWHESYSILTGTLKLVIDGEYVMAAGFALFVIVLPLVLYISQLLSCLYQLTGRGGGRAVAWLVEFDRWVMTDVFALALFVAIVRLGQWTTVTPRPGLYFFGAAIAVSPLVSFWLRRLYRREET